MFMNISLNVIFHAHKWKVSFGKPYVVGYIFAWPCDGKRMGKMAVMWHASITPVNFDFSVIVNQITFPFTSFPVLPHVFPQGIWLSKLQTVFLVHTK